MKLSPREGHFVCRRRSSPPPRNTARGPFCANEVKASPPPKSAAVKGRKENCRIASETQFLTEGGEGGSETGAIF